MEEEPFSVHLLYNKGHYSLIKTGRKVWKRFKGKAGNKGGEEKEAQRDHKSTPFNCATRPAKREKKQNRQPTAHGCMIIIITSLKSTQYNLIKMYLVATASNECL